MAHSDPIPGPADPAVDPVTVPDLRLVPLAAAAWAATWSGTAGVSWPVGLVLSAVVVVVVAAVLRRSVVNATLAVVLALGLGIGLLHAHRVGTGPLMDLARQEAAVTMELTTRTDPHLKEADGVRPAYALLRARAMVVHGRGAGWRIRSPVLVIASGTQLEQWRRLPVGTTLRTTGRLQAPEPGADVAAVVRVRGPTEVLAPPGAAMRAVEHVRSGLRAAVSARSPEQRALVPALVLGDTSAMSDAITSDFQATGLTHLTAVSGANLTLLLAFMLAASRWVGVRGRWLRLVGLVGVVVFVLLCRTEPSVLRAAAMGLVALAALGSGGRRKGLQNLSVAMLALLLADPYLSRSIGFALSVLASAGIVWWAGDWTERLHRWLPRLVAESVAVPLAAHLATLAVVAGISGRVSVVGIVTNALAGPFVGPATVLGFAAAGLSVVSPTLAVVAGFGAAWSAQVILWVAHAGARFPGASWPWPATPPALLLLGAIALALGMLMPYVLSRRLPVILLAVVMVAWFVRAPAQPGWPPPDWVLVACDVGQGDGLLVRVGERQAMVVDVGPDPALMRRCLDQLGIVAVPVVLLTHFHADHVDGLRGVLEDERVGQLWVSPLASPAAEAAAVSSDAQARGIPVLTPAVGETGTVGDVAFEVLGPRGRTSPTGVGDGDLSDTGQESSAENDASLVLRVSVRGVRILLTGDVEPNGQAAILASGADLRADVLKIPHHGSARQDPAFFAATGATVAIASAGLDNSYGHPAPRTLQLVASLGMTVLRTDLQGSVAVTEEAGRLAAVTQR